MPAQGYWANSRGLLLVILGGEGEGLTTPLRERMRLPPAIIQRKPWIALGKDEWPTTWQFDQRGRSSRKGRSIQKGQEDSALLLGWKVNGNKRQQEESKPKRAGRQI